MKTRSLLFGLGIFVTLSLGTPVFAARNEPMNNRVAVESTETDSDEKSSPEGSVEESEQGYTWELHDGQWFLKYDGEAIVEERQGYYLYKIDGFYYCLDQTGKMLTGFITIDSDAVNATNDLEEDGKVEKPLSGTYYFEVADSDAASPTTCGMMAMNCWRLEENDQNRWHWLAESGVSADLSEVDKDGWQEIDGKWYELDREGNISSGKTGWQNVDSENQIWYYLNEDGSVDTGKNGLESVSEDLWLETENGKGIPASDWHEVSSGKWYFFKDGKRDAKKTGLQTINGKIYNLKVDGTVLTGFQTVEGQTYYFAKDGVRQSYTGWKSIDGELYYFNANYQVATQSINGWVQIDEKWYWFESGKMITGWKQVNGTWYYMDAKTGIMKTGFYTVGGQTYYSDDSGAMLGGGWHKLKNVWYYMQESGAVQTGWLLDRGTWYWLGTDGVMQTGWYKVSGKEYYSDGSGAMQTGWLLYKNHWYYLQSSGAKAAGWIIPDGKTWYYLNPSDGVMQTGWYLINGTWYYSNGSGAMQTGWVIPDGKTWYYLNGSGAMQTGWYQVGGTWYYSNSSGAMQTGWQMINGTWYYLASSGAMAANQWIDGYYYVNGSGAMVTSTWVGNYYVGADGRWIPNYDPVTYGGKWIQENGKWYFETGDGAKLANRWQKINGVWYWFDSAGVMATGWKYIGGLKYYFNGSGALVQDLENVIGKQSSYYITVNRIKCQVTVYAKDGANGYVIPFKTFTCSVGLPAADTATPTGTYRTLEKYRTKMLMGPSWGKWATRIVGGVLFHSVACSDGNNITYSLPAGEYNKLGVPASHGCVRLTVRDAKWIYDNCALGTTVKIGDNEIQTPFDKPATIKIPATQNWDPTDPEVNR